MITSQILGQPGRDNAAYVVVDTGQTTHRLLFDCGYGCLDALAVADIMSLESVCFSHFHMYHISGFDALFRFNYDRGERPPLRLIGPVDTRRVLQHRMQAYTWNLVDNATGSVIVDEFGNGRLCSSTFRTREQFRVPECEESRDFEPGAGPDSKLQSLQLFAHAERLLAGSTPKNAGRDPPSYEQEAFNGSSMFELLVNRELRAPPQFALPSAPEREIISSIRRSSSVA